MQPKSKQESFASYRSLLSPDLSPEEFVLFRDHIAEQSGLFLDESKMDSLRISLLARATLHDFSSYLEYLDFMRESPGEFNELLSLITNNETSFFRYPGQFEALCALLPEIMARRATLDRRIRIWSAGCSTGEEPYSIAMCVLDYLGEDISWSLEVFGTDVSKRALAICESGVYDEKAIRSLEPRWHRYMERAGDKWRAGPLLKKTVSFGYHNLIKEPYPLSVMSDWDIIFCRNVTIYFKLESTRRVIKNFYQSLNPGGFLFIGHSETLRTISDDFASREVNGVFVYQKQEEPWAPGVKEISSQTRSRADEEPGTGEETVRQADTSFAELLRQATDEFEQGHIDQARPLLEAALSRQPDNADVNLILSYIYANEGQYQSAIDCCRKTLDVQPLSARAHYLLGVVYDKVGKPDDAEQEFKKTLYADPNFALAHLNLANIYRMQGKNDLARRAYHNAIDLLMQQPEGDWVEFLGGFMGDLVAETAKKGLAQVGRGAGKGRKQQD
ncbi:MAG: hypothetical protein C4521_01200 [Actinobacteria bacterium]|nr:MAG: hypothetical protein C4521_01200 [Actinomycetota bacterium]